MVQVKSLRVQGGAVLSIEDTCVFSSSVFVDSATLELNGGTVRTFTVHPPFFLEKSLFSLLKREFYLFMLHCVTVSCARFQLMFEI